jgi:hypothetical protein
MVIGAFLDAGLDFEFLQQELAKLDLKGYQLKAKKENRNHLWGTRFKAEVKESSSARHLPEILHLIEQSSLDSWVKEKSAFVFKKLAEEEAKIHQTVPEKIHFHEVGAVDSIVDIVGCMIGFSFFKVRVAFTSPINLGSGTIKCKHGVLPIPAPATIALLRGYSVYPSPVQAELTTPTGAAIISTLASPRENYPLLKIEKIGLGVGSKKLDSLPNLLRVVIGEMVERYEEDVVTVIKTNVDDLNPQIYDYLFERLFEEGALDVTLTPILMKKNRPGQEITVLVEKINEAKIIEVLFKETTSIGLRRYEVGRKKLPRQLKKIKTKYGELTVKESKLDQRNIKKTPEYEECKKIAREKKIPLRKILTEIK